MHGILPRRNTEEDRIVLGLLESVERGSARSQRRLAAELGIALGLVNLYLKRCVNKGLVKVAEAPARRYAYYLTPQGFAEKARLTLEFLSYSFELFRRAKTDCASVFEVARSREIQPGRAGRCVGHSRNRNNVRTRDRYSDCGDCGPAIEPVDVQGGFGCNFLWNRHERFSSRHHYRPYYRSENI